MKKEDFTIEGPESLKRAFVEEGGFGDSLIDYNSYLTSSDIRKRYLTSRGICFPVHFKLPQDWNKALEYVKDFWEVETKKSLYFGDVEFICDRETKTADTPYGKVTLEEIDNLIKYVYSPPKLGKGSLYTGVQGCNTKLRIGDYMGTLGELEKIQLFFRDKKF